MESSNFLQFTELNFQFLKLKVRLFRQDKLQFTQKILQRIVLTNKLSSTEIMITKLRKHKSDSNFFPFTSCSTNFQTPQTGSRLSYLQTDDHFYKKSRKQSNCETLISDYQDYSKVSVGDKLNKYKSIENNIKGKYSSLNDFQNQVSSENREFNKKREKIIEINDRKYYFHSPKNHKFNGNIEQYFQTNRNILKGSLSSQHLIVSPHFLKKKLSNQNLNAYPVQITNYNYYLGKQNKLQDLIASNSHLNHPMHSLSRMERNLQNQNKQKQSINTKQNNSKYYAYVEQEAYNLSQGSQQELEHIYHLNSKKNSKSRSKPYNSSNQDRKNHSNIMMNRSDILIQEYERQNLLLQKQNEKFQKTIKTKVNKENQLIQKLNGLIREIQKLKQRQILNLQDQMKEQDITARLEQFTRQESLKESQQRLHNHNKYLQNQICSAYPSEIMLLNSTNDNQVQKLQKGSLRNKRKVEFQNILQSEQSSFIRQNNKKKTTDSILEYSLIDDSTFNPLRNYSRDHHSYVDQSINPNRQKNNQCIDLSISGFDSRLVPRLTNQEKLKELEELFQKSLINMHRNEDQQKQNFKPITIKNSLNIKGRLKSSTQENVYDNSPNMKLNNLSLGSVSKQELNKICQQITILRNLIKEEYKQNINAS